MTTSEAQKALQRALKTLAKDQAPRARRNARRRVRAATRALLRSVDAAYPAPVKEREKISPRTAELRRLRRDQAVIQGWASVTLIGNRGLMEACALAGVKLRQAGGEAFAPPWAYAAWKADNTLDLTQSASLLRKLKNDPKGQTRVLAVHNLKQSNPLK